MCSTNKSRVDKWCITKNICGQIELYLSNITLI